MSAVSQVLAEVVRDGRTYLSGVAWWCGQRAKCWCTRDGLGDLSLSGGARCRNKVCVVRRGERSAAKSVCCRLHRRTLKLHMHG